MNSATLSLVEIGSLSEPGSLTQNLKDWCDQAHHVSKRLKNLSPLPEPERLIVDLILARGDFMVYRAENELVDWQSLNLSLNQLKAYLCFIHDQRRLFEPLMSDEEARRVDKLMGADWNECVEAVGR